MNLANNNAVENIQTTLPLKDQIKRAEIKLAAFFAEHNVAFRTADHLIPLLKDICIDPTVVQNLSLARTKCNSIVKNILAKTEVERTVENLQTCRFSILIDETTDITETKLMCILVRYISPLNKQITTQLLDLLTLDATDCSAGKIFEKFKILLEEKQIPIKNIVGMACDNASVMIGCNNSFMSRLKLEVPGLVTLNCICHSSALVASKACEKLPSSCENVIRSISTYISGSAKRCAILGEFQDFFHVERKKVIKLSSTRWLVLHKCVVRLLENWEVFKNFFILATVEDKLTSAENILAELNNDSNKAYFLFLKYSLNIFNTFNALFQANEILIHKLHKKSQELISLIAQNFMNFDVSKNISTLDIENPENIHCIENIYVGPDCECFLNTLSLECAKEIKSKCLDFYITAVREMLKRLPYNDIFFEQLSFLEPKIALYNESRLKIKNLTYIATYVKHDDVTKLAFEWRMLPLVFDDDQKKELASLKIDKMWQKILESKDFDGEKMFPNLESLVEIVLSFPHSNAEAERIFSIVTDVKNKKRNRLSDDCVSAICVVRSSFQAKGINCTNFEIEPRHLELYAKFIR